MPDRLLRLLVAQGTRRGLRGGSRTWMLVGAIAWLARHAIRREEDVVYAEELRSGQQLIVKHLPGPPGGRARRGARRAP